MYLLFLQLTVYLGLLIRSSDVSRSFKYFGNYLSKHGRRLKNYSKVHGGDEFFASILCTLLYIHLSGIGFLFNFLNNI
jgi:hypothetical protein